MTEKPVEKTLARRDNGRTDGTPNERPCVVLVLQGGGALGAYHLGAYQALHDAGFLPEWVAGTSIGAINAAVIAGNRPEHRLARLEQLWDEISRPDPWDRLFAGPFRRWYNAWSHMQALCLGQPNFFLPRFPSPWFVAPGSPGATSFYDTTPLRRTLERLVDFDLLNARTMRVSLGATAVQTGELKFFDSTRDRIGPDHVLASGSLPPGFPPTEVDGKFYWDGGCVSNTPLQAVLDDLPDRHVVVFLIDLWNACGEVPRTMDEVLWRQKEIQYANRSVSDAARAVELVNLRRARDEASARAGAVAGARDVLPPVRGPRLNVLHIVYRLTDDQVPQSDCEFSRASIAARRAAGYTEMQQAIREAPWLTPPTAGAAVLHHVRRGSVEMAPAAIAQHSA